MTQIIARGSKDDGTVNLYARIYKRNVMNNAVALGISLSEADWKSVERTLKFATEAEKCGSPVSIRDTLVQNLWNVKIGLDAMLDDGVLTIETAKRYVTSIMKPTVVYEVEQSEQEKRMTLKEWIAEFIRQCETGERLKQNSTQKIKEGTLKNWRTTLRRLEEYERYAHCVLDFDDMTLDFYYNWKQFFIKKRFTPNTIGKYVKALKIFLRAAKDMKLTTTTDFESRRFSVDMVEVDNVYLTEERVWQMYLFNPTDKEQVEKALNRFSGKELKELRNDVDKASSCLAMEKAKDVFVVGCLTGQRLSDYKRISTDMICELRDGREYIQLTQQKTEKMVYLPLDQRVRAILEKYGGSLPKVYDQKVNKHIKTVGHLLGWTEDAGIMEQKGLMKANSGKKFYECVKSHTARRTFATNAYKNGISLSSIMAITGHSSELMLRKYLKLDNKERAIMAAEEFARAKEVKLKIAE